ncbi:MAG: preprotein translocase subunit SecA [Candidatus Pacebacteria bacterium]|nr:preprotein translocase subunit SecA [Candidatus Paceibacterota bacterium]
MSILDKIFGDPNEKEVKKMQPTVDRINALEEKYKKMTDEELKGQTGILKARLKKGEDLDAILPEAFATVRETSSRVLGQRHYDVQLIGGIVLHKGQIAEMKTGEGKTLVSTLPVYLNALTGDGVHIVTVNDYLAKRDANWMGPIYNFLGLSVASIQHDHSFLFEPQTAPDGQEVTIEMQNLREISRKEAYAADITYGTNNEFGFDYLRDNMAVQNRQLSQRELNFAVVDEIDSILIDEARTPLIISAPDMDSDNMYDSFSRLVPRLQKEADYTVDEKMNAVSLTEEGIDKVEALLGMKNIYDEGGITLVHHLEQALKAEILFKRDKDYMVKDDEVIIIDEFTGRAMPGRRFSEGLHQAIEAKEKVKIQKESRTLATITFQNYFRLYKKLAGMTGTAATSSEEFGKVYKLEVLVIPTNKDIKRTDRSDSIYKTEKGKFMALVREIKERNKKGQPVLVGTISIEKSEAISELLKREGVPHEVLNAKFHEKEALIVANAGQKNAVTIATNMAGRGTDIKLGEGVEELGGLCILGTERHEARRIDNQLRGRSGRQGEPGETQFYVSTEDHLMRVFGSEKMKSVMDTFGIAEDMPIENSFISKQLEAAQKKIEGFNFDLRKHILDYDDVMNRQRESIYKRRRDILNATKRIEENNDQLPVTKENFSELLKLKDKVLDMLEKQTQDIVSVRSADTRGNWDVKGMWEAANKIAPIEESIKNAIEEIIESDKPDEMAKGEVVDLLYGAICKDYNEKEEGMGYETARQIEKMVLLRSIDVLWMEHLTSMDCLRDGIGLRGYGQRDPLVEYKKEAYRMYHDLIKAIEENVVTSLFKIRVARKIESPMENKKVQESGGSVDESEASKPEVNTDKHGRNDLCPCGSGKKYKKCCGK